MSGALLVENKLHHEYWRKKSGETTIAYSTASGYAAPPAGFSFANALDDNAGTSFMISSFSEQVIAEMAFPVGVTVNGFCFYGHNLTSNQGIKITYSTATTGTTNFVDFKGTPYTSNLYKPTDNFYKPFGAVFANPISAIRRLRIETVAWGVESYMQIMSSGMWLTDNIDISLPFVPPTFSPQEASIKRNNNGNHLISDVRKVPQKLQINLNHFSEADLYLGSDDAQTTIINGLSATYPYAEYLGYFLSRHPFFFMYNKGASTDANSKQIFDQEKIYFCTVDKTLSQPKYSSPTLLSWTIKALGYME